MIVANWGGFWAQLDKMRAEKVKEGRSAFLKKSAQKTFITRGF